MNATVKLVREKLDKVSSIVCTLSFWLTTMPIS